MNALLFAATVLIWGTTWIAIAAQVGAVPLLQSIFLRFALAGLVMLAGLALMGRLRRPAQLRFVVVQALCLFSFNFIGLYNAAAPPPRKPASAIRATSFQSTITRPPVPRAMGKR